MRGNAAMIVLFALFCAGIARAERGDAAAAEQLFSAGREAFARGDYETACPSFEESQRLDPAAGTLINLAACYDKIGRLASAWESWRGALRSLSPNDERRPAVERLAEAMEQRVPRLHIEIAPQAPAGTRVKRGSVELGAASLGVPLPVDPGRHVVTASAPGRLEQRYEVLLVEGKTHKLVVEPGKPVTVTPPPAAAPLEPRQVRFDPAPERPSGGGSARTLGFVLAGTGIAGIAVGSVAGIVALGKKDAMLEDCEKIDNGYACGPAGMDAARDGNTFATVSTVAFAAGAVATSAGIWLILASSRSSERRVETALSMRPLAAGAALGLSGRY